MKYVYTLGYSYHRNYIQTDGNEYIRPRSALYRHLSLRITRPANGNVTVQKTVTEVPLTDVWPLLRRWIPFKEGL